MEGFNHRGLSIDNPSEKGKTALQTGHIGGRGEN